jgi:hypothetical protein
MSRVGVVRDIYRDYKIMPALAEHQFRVAGVACAIMEVLDTDVMAAPFYKNEVISACLFHDMGNILKFDLARFPEFLGSEGLAYWEGIKKDFITKYGSDEHAATRSIAEEIGISARTREYIDAVGFSNAEATAQSGSLEEMICCYADQRVAPYAVVSLAERFEDGARRYAGRAHRIADAAYAVVQVGALTKMEKHIFAHATIVPEAITEAVSEKYFPMLEHFVIV